MSDRFDDELRDAIAPLRGDPSEVWARVLEQMPVPRSRRVLPLVAGAVAAGLAIGWVAALLTRAAPAATVEPVPVQNVALAQPVRVLGRNGETMIQTETGVRKLGVGDAFGFQEIVATGNDGQLYLGLPGDIELRLNVGTRVTLEGEHSATLARGQLFVAKRGGNETYVVMTQDGEVHTERGDLSIVVAAKGSEIVALDGKVRFASLAGEERLLGPRERVEIRDGALGQKVAAGPRWRYVAWQVDALSGCVDRREEAFGYAYELIRALDDPTTAVEAERALRSANSLGAMAAGMAAIDLPDDQAQLRRRCWLLLSDMADSTSLPYLHRGILNQDPDVRSASVRAIERITAVPSEHDERFWREAAEAERFDAVQRWRKRLRDD